MKNTISETVGGFVRTLEITPAYDKRHSDPKKNYGIHGVNMRFVLRGPRGATQWLFCTGMHLPHVANEHNHGGYMAADIGYHSPNPMYEGQSSTSKCPYVEGGECYHDGSSLQAERLLEPFLSQGPDDVWRDLEDEYRSRFGDEQ